MSRGSFVNDLLCAQLHPPGSCRMVMVVHVVDAKEHETGAYRVGNAAVNELLRLHCAARLSAWLATDDVEHARRDEQRRRTPACREPLTLKTRCLRTGERRRVLESRQYGQ